jgi:hypothetical protein
MRWAIVLLCTVVLAFPTSTLTKKEQKSKKYEYQRAKLPPLTISASPEPETVNEETTLIPAAPAAPAAPSTPGDAAQEGAGEITEEDLGGLGSDSCQWLPERLNGRCWGLTSTTDFKDDKGVRQRKIANAMDCQKLCCELGDKCISYQYVVSTKSCTIGKEVRLGKETGKTDIWCDSTAPHRWTGHVLIHHPVGTCNWGAPLPYQCWDFGAERLSADGQRLNAKDCAIACCKLAVCEAWQEHPTRGCFYNDKATDGGVDCDGGLEIYHGRRKKRPSR